MSILNIINSIDDKIDEAKSLYQRGAYREASSKLEFTKFQSLTISEHQFLEATYIYALCSYELGEYDIVKLCCNQIINYPNYNNNYISKAEELLQELP